MRIFNFVLPCRGGLEVRLSPILGTALSPTPVATRIKHSYGRRVLRKTNVGRRVAIIAGLTLTFMAALAAFLLWYLGGQEKAATREANKFIAALVKDDPSAAPRKGDEYVRGMWRVYRRIDSAKLIDTHQRSTHHATSGSGHSWWVADVLLHTGHGLAVVELAFEPNHLDPDCTPAARAS